MQTIQIYDENGKKIGEHYLNKEGFIVATGGDLSV